MWLKISSSENSSCVWIMAWMNHVFPCGRVRKHKFRVLGEHSLQLDWKQEQQSGYSWIKAAWRMGKFRGDIYNFLWHFYLVTCWLLSHFQMSLGRLVGVECNPVPTPLSLFISSFLFCFQAALPGHPWLSGPGGSCVFRSWIQTL